MLLHDEHAGVLHENDLGVVEFRLDPGYQRRPHRPVLGQWFEDHPRGIQRGDRPGALPPFFANLIPEGDLGLLLRDRLQVPDHDDFGLLAAVGGDLPGAIAVEMTDPAPAPIRRDADADAPTTNLGADFRFSLAGVQLKFSMLRTADRFSFPGRDARGNWIVKIALDSFTGLCENEFVTMEWARATGFSVPACELRPIADLVDVPASARHASVAFVIERFDRDGAKRIHQEDFQQILGRRPDRKYDDLTYEAMVLLAMKIVGPEAFDEMLRRLVFMVASGTNEAHAKNWSVLYPDRIQASRPRSTIKVFTAPVARLPPGPSR